ncbi:MAG: translation initiation factor IF-2 [Clostridia bacterium]|nr:translation initiation factor IF-2 [Clostridia bacterium]
MAQEQKQTKTFSVEFLKKLIAQVSSGGEFLAYRKEIEQAQTKVVSVLSSCRDISFTVNKKKAEERATEVDKTENVEIKSDIARKEKPSSTKKEVEKPKTPVSDSKQKTVTTPMATVKTKRMDNTPSYVKGVVNLKQEPKKPRTQTKTAPTQRATTSPQTPSAPRPTLSKLTTPPPTVNIVKPRKTADKKKDTVKYEEKKSMTKRTLIRKGFIQDDIDDDRVRVRKLKNKKKTEQVIAEPKVIDNVTITSTQVTVKQLSELIGVSAQEIMKKMLMMGGAPITSINSVVDFDTLFLVADSFGVTLTQKLAQSQEELAEALHDEVDDEKDLLPRPPVITVMGHVDHGKTSLLDAIRKTNVVSGEAGGITQHIGAYSVSWEYEKKKRLITFLDTPGHEAFTEMRARGSKITDIVILVVAADDGVQPQTIEAINHVKAANAPLIVAINKIDKPTANIDKIKEELSVHGIITDEWGGDTRMVPISAKKRIGIDTLLEEILFLADLNDYKANPNRKARGAIVEARLDRGKGPIATIIVQNGTLKSGDAVVCGTTYGKIRSMTDSSGKIVKTALPSTAVSVMGLSGIPNAGDDMWVVEDEKTAKEIAEGRIEKDRLSHVEDMAIKSFELNTLKDLNVIIKADVQGSAEALKNSIAKLVNEEVKVSVVHCAVGMINKSDMMLAEVTNAMVIGFNVKPDSEARIIAEQSKINIGSYSVIYDAIDAVESAMSGMTEPKYQEVYIGTAQVRNIFKISSVGVVAGSYVLDGKIQRGAKVLVKRRGETVYEGTISGLKRFKDDAKEVATGFECGISVDGYSDFVLDDEIEAYVMERIK